MRIGLKCLVVVLPLLSAVGFFVAKKAMPEPVLDQAKQRQLDADMVGNRKILKGAGTDGIHDLVEVMETVFRNPVPSELKLDGDRAEWVLEKSAMDRPDFVLHYSHYGAATWAALWDEYVLWADFKRDPTFVVTDGNGRVIYYFDGANRNRLKEFCLRLF